MTHRAGLLVFWLFTSLVSFQFFAATLEAHTLPISYLTVVPGADHVHLELVLNPFELNSFSELDQNRNGRLDPTELEARDSFLTQLLREHLNLSVNGKRISAEVAGFTPDLDSHHISFRAHYRVDARQQSLTITSTLNSITSGSHITQVNYLESGRSRAARLDMNTPTVTMKLGEHEGDQAHSSPVTRAPVIAVVSLLGILPALAIVLGLIWAFHREFRPRRTG